MKDKVLGLDVSQRMSVHPAEGGIDGTYLVTRNNFLSIIVRAFLGHNYHNNLRLQVTLKNAHWQTGTRGDTVYTVENGQLVERVDLPLFAIGSLDPRVTRVQSNG